jgi:ATPase subunit of ABC transporter with duplicated ATPase domains
LKNVATGKRGKLSLAKVLLAKDSFLALNRPTSNLSVDLNKSALKALIHLYPLRVKK